MNILYFCLETLDLPSLTAPPNWTLADAPPRICKRWMVNVVFTHAHSAPVYRWNKSASSRFPGTCEGIMRVRLHLLRVLHSWTDGCTNNADEFHQVWHRHCVKHSCDTNALKPTPFQVRGGNKKAQRLNNTAEGGWCVKSVSLWKIELQPWTRESGISPHYRSSGTQGKMVTQMCSSSTDESWQDMWDLTGPLPQTDLPRGGNLFSLPVSVTWSGAAALQWGGPMLCGEWRSGRANPDPVLSRVCACDRMDDCSDKTSGPANMSDSCRSIQSSSYNVHDNRGNHTMKQNFVEILFVLRVYQLFLLHQMFSK